jgi:hypothetical protein
LRKEMILQLISRSRYEAWPQWQDRPYLWKILSLLLFIYFHSLYACTEFFLLHTVLLQHLDSASCEVCYVLPVVQWLRFALSKGPNKVDVSLPSAEDGNISS